MFRPKNCSTEQNKSVGKMFDQNKIWSKKFESRIISDIYQIDMYKNGRLQFVFLTYEYLYILDVKGNIVKKTANKENTSKKYLSVFILFGVLFGIIYQIIDNPVINIRAPIIITAKCL